MKDYKCKKCGKIFKDLFPEEVKECCGVIPEAIFVKVNVSHKTSTIYCVDGRFDSWESIHHLADETQGKWQTEQKEDMVQKIFDDTALGEKHENT